MCSDSVSAAAAGFTFNWSDDIHFSVPNAADAVVFTAASPLILLLSVSLNLINVRIMGMYHQRCLSSKKNAKNH